MRIRQGDEVLAPSYNCGIEIDTLLSCGASVVLYRVGKDGLIDFDDLRSKVRDRTKIVYVIHYFGFPQPLSEIKDLCRQKGLFLVEDCALSTFSCNGTTPLGSVGDIAVFTLRKTLPVPDGGAMVINNPDLAPDCWKRRDTSVLKISRGMLSLAKRYLLHVSSRSNVLYSMLWGLVQKPATEIEHNVQMNTTFPDMPSDFYYDGKLSNRGMSRISRRMLETFDAPEIVEKRRANYGKYLELLSGSEGIEILYTDLPKGVCPLYFPVIVGNRAEVCRQLNAASIEAIAWWAGYHRSLPWNDYPDACFLKDNLLVLPVHPQLNDKHIEFVVQKLVGAIGGRDAHHSSYQTSKTVSTSRAAVTSSRDDFRRTDIVCFGGEDWWYHNRGHIDFQLMRRFAATGTVLFINSIIMQKPKAGKKGQLFTKVVRKVKSIFRGLKHIENGFWVFSPVSLPVNHIRWLRPLNEALLALQISSAARRLKLHTPLVWVAIPVACNIARKLRKSKLVYQRTDRFEDTPLVNSQITSQDDKTLKRDADLTIYVSTGLYEQERAQCKRAFFLDHGVDYDLFSSADKGGKTLPDIAAIPGPIAGYIGTVEDIKMDVGYIEAVVDLLPEVSFVFVGKVDAGFLRLKEKKNVWLLGQKPYEQIPQYGKHFDVAIIPWRQSDWASAANPIKLKEYLALGKPIISTPVFGEIEEYRDLIYVARTPEEFVMSIKEAMRHDSPEMAAKRRDKVKESSWDSKAQLVLAELCS
jgi:dTDP-4-amino-4,6-dideoxygalactose transaminase/glycosyltransferase involved in cell wall biosynthesis